MTVIASLGGQTIASSDDTVVVEGNHYFPLDDVHAEHFTKTRMHTLCPWKGVASYWTVEAGGVRAQNAAWTYRHASPLARRIRNRVAFQGAVEIRKVSAA